MSAAAQCALRCISASMNLCGVAFSAEEADELLTRCDELAGLMSLWAKRSAAVQSAAQELSSSAGLTPRKDTPRPGPGSGVTARPSGSHRQLRVAEPVGDFRWAQTPSTSSGGSGQDGQDGGSVARRDGGAGSSSSSDSLDLDLDDWDSGWSPRQRASEDSDSGGEEGEAAVWPSSAFAFLGRMSPHILERIDEGEGFEPSSSSEATGEASDSSGASSLERAWASVPEVGYGASALSPEAAATAAAAQPSGMPLAQASASADSRKSSHTRGCKGRSSSRQAEQRYRAEKFVHNGVSEVLASWRTCRSCLGPKEEGPLSRMQERVGAVGTE